MSTIYGMLVMMPLLFGSAGYVLVSSGGTAETAGKSKVAAKWRSMRSFGRRA